ncbi:MAG: HAD family hydrolase [Actinomycetia bacterium]|nr:HAD family hydrolase [Actinomycetes bacterium]MCP3909410.1 HAD family hydrolase [Actinomycetes bacterium]
MTVPRLVFDLDGTLLDSDAALRHPFLALGVPEEDITYGHVIAEECRRLGLGLDDYLDHYDPHEAQPFPGVEALVVGLGPWAICSNKHPRSGESELARLGWNPVEAWFANRYDGPKDLRPLLGHLGWRPASITFVGDTNHDRVCAQQAGCRFVLAGWNPRTDPRPGDLVAGEPAELLDLISQ